MKKVRAQTMTHDYKRHGTTTLFTALNTLDGTVMAMYTDRTIDETLVLVDIQTDRTHNCTLLGV
jgi:hypothetical protein